MDDKTISSCDDDSKGPGTHIEELDAKNRKRKQFSTSLPASSLLGMVERDGDTIDLDTRMETKSLASDKDPVGRQVSLMLGMIQGDFRDHTPTRIGNSMSGTSQLRRDSARCEATERLVERDVYTLDIRTAPGYPDRPDRHIVQSLKTLNPDKLPPLLVAISKKVVQICLDYFWFVDGYWGGILNDNFFTVPVWVLHDILSPAGVMYLGLSVHLLLGVLRHLDSLEPKFHISLVLDTEVDEIDLVCGSHQIPDELYAYI